MSDDLVERVGRELARTGYAFAVRHLTDPYTDDADYWNSQARAAIAVVLEAAAKVCDGIESETWRLWKTHYDMLDQGRSDGAGDCAAAIRALVKT